MKLTLASVGKGGQKWADDGAEQWLKRIRHKWRIDEIRLKPAPDRGVMDARRELESQALLKRCPAGHRLIALDERGADLSTEAFADLISKAMNQGTKGLFFAIGGPFGHHASLRQQAHKTLRLSKMVLNHELARVMLAEQLYRASNLIWGGNYHH